jgi:hypothetical protein
MMSSEDKIKFLFERSKLEVDSSVDEKILNDAFDALAKQTPVAVESIRWILIAKYAAAAVIIISCGLLLVNPGPDEQVEPRRVVTAQRSPAEMMTMVSFAMAYRSGGLEAVEEICDETYNRVGPRSNSTLLKGLYEELDS